MQRADDIRAAFRRAKNLCNPENKNTPNREPTPVAPPISHGKYAALAAAHAEIVSRPPPAKVPTISQTKEGEVRREPKSYAQVETYVEQQVVRQKSGGLKPEGEKSFRIGIRLSSQERQLVLGRASNSGLKLSAYARAALLGADYIAQQDPVRRKLLQDLSRELGHQGNNLNQIAKQLNSGFVTQDDAYALLNDLGGSLVAAHNAVRLAMTEGKVKS